MPDSQSLGSRSVSDAPIPYQAQGNKFYHDGREIELLDFVFQIDRSEDIQGDSNKVLDAIDRFGQEKKYLMNIGPHKGQIVQDRICDYVRAAKYRPITMIELGAYVGYSAIMFSRLLPGGSRYISLEAIPEFAAVSTKMIELAGLSASARVVVGPADESIPKLKERLAISKIDIVFLDHAKERYLPDLRLLESLGLIQPGTLLIADNVIKPGNPKYLAYVRGESQTDEEKAHKYESEMSPAVEPSGVKDAVEFSLCIS